MPRVIGNAPGSFEVARVVRRAAMSSACIQPVDRSSGDRREVPRPLRRRRFHAFEIIVTKTRRTRSHVGHRVTETQRIRRGRPAQLAPRTAENRKRTTHLERLPVVHFRGFRAFSAASRRRVASYPVSLCLRASVALWPISSFLTSPDRSVSVRTIRHDDTSRRIPAACSTRCCRSSRKRARIISLDRGIWRILTNPKRQIIVSCPVQMDNGEIEVFTGYRVQYNVTLGPAKGGIRYHPDVIARRGHARSPPG